MRGVVAVILLGAAMVFGAVTTSTAASLTARIDISNQTMTVSEYGRVVHRWKVSTARRGYRTPRGTYRPIRMHRMWHSRKYHNSPMPYSIFFLGGYAIHGTYETRSLGRPASHGCVRLLPRNAATFFAMVRAVGPNNTRIVVAN